MRVRDHALLSTAGAALLYPRLGRHVCGAWAASLLIDLDHYAWFCFHERRLNPIRAVRFFNQAQPPQHAATRILHHPLILFWLLLFAGKRWMRLVLLGMAFHVALDVYHAVRLARARQAALRRDGYSCQSCGAGSDDVVAHLQRQPCLLPSYRVGDLTALCAACHERAHEPTRRSIIVPPSALAAILVTAEL